MSVKFVSLAGKDKGFDSLKSPNFLQQFLSMFHFLAITLFSLEINRQVFAVNSRDEIVQNKLHVQLFVAKQGQEFEELLLTNVSNDTLQLSNIVPLGFSNSYPCITGLGEHPLSRTHLFLPGKIPVNLVCPDNAWELGFSSQPLADSSVSALARRDRNSLKNGHRKRFETILYPGGSIVYKIWTHKHVGSWQEGLRYFFQQKKLYDLALFDDSLFKRKDLEWIRHSYVIHLFQAWDKFYFDRKDDRFHWKEFFDRGKKLYGGDDVIGIWPTWPSLGLDHRNQFDQFRDLPQGTIGLRKMGEELRKNGSHLFLCYNPWDESTRNEGHMAGLGKLIKETMADGVVLDTRGASSKELQEAADRVKKGVVMYSEGMAVPFDMPGIVSGRVHNALYFVPMLNLNKLIQPSFAIFRVAELFKEPIRREFATSFFNGYGTELNVFAPGQPDWVETQYKYLGKTTRILRENSLVFTEGKLTPLLSIPMDSLWVNQWEMSNKTIYTVFSIRPQGTKIACLPVRPKKDFHFVDLWHHKLLTPIESKGQQWVELETEAFHEKWLGTNNEGEVDCIAELPLLLQLQLKGDRLNIHCTAGDSLKIWAGVPDYSKTPVTLKSGNHELVVSKLFGRFEGAIIVQLFDKNALLDENKVELVAGTPRKISETDSVKAFEKNKRNDELMPIPAGKFVFKETHGDDFIPYPTELVGDTLFMPAFKMAKHPVTNRQFKQFLLATHYQPKDAANFLKHWKNGMIPKGEEEFPVVYVSQSDAKAYAKWRGLRLPTEQEWQYAAQTQEMNQWPWAGDYDSSLCNTGNGKPHAVGSYPKGTNSLGLQDLVGCVWQLTNDEYQSGSYRYILLKGGSYFKPSSSWWYVQGGPKELTYRQFLLRVSDGFERNATVGFRLISPK